MWSVIGLGLGAYILYSAINTVLSFNRNLKQAKQSGIPYVVVPIYFLQTWWLAGHPLLLPFLRKLPKSWTVSYPIYPRAKSVDLYQAQSAETQFRNGSTFASRISTTDVASSASSESALIPS
jgi:hypothetical protein